MGTWSFRRTGVRLAATGTGVIFMWACLDGMFRGEHGADPSTLQRALYGAMLLVGVWATIRMARLGIFVSDDEVIFRNFGRTRTLRWDEIARFEPPGRRRNPIKNGLGARLKGGTVVTSTLYSPGVLNGPDFADWEVKTLNRLLAEHLASQGEAGGGH